MSDTRYTGNGSLNTTGFHLSHLHHTLTYSIISESILDSDALQQPQLQAHSHTNFITVNRPDSSQLVDLHVYFLPRSSWKDRQNLAYNDAMEEAYSAGFIRVNNYLTLHELRNEIENQCGSDEAFPKEFVYLRSVGRAMTRVKEKQELELRVKHFRPPQTFAPELFLLEYRHDDYVNVPATPNTSSSTSTSQNFMNKPRVVKSPSTSRINENDISWKKGNTNVAVLSSTEKDEWGENESVKSKDFEKLHEEQERLKRRQNELERLRREVEERQKQLQDEELRKKKLAEKARYDRLREIEHKRHNAAIVIQSVFRGYYVRKRFFEYKKQKQQEYIRKLRERTTNAHSNLDYVSKSSSTLNNAKINDTDERRSVIRSKAFSGSIRDILGQDYDKKTISQLSSDDEDTRSERTLITVTVEQNDVPFTNTHPHSSTRLSHVLKSQDNFMYRTEFDNRRNIHDDSHLTSPVPSMSSFDPKSAKHSNIYEQPIKTTSPTKTPTSPLFRRTKTHKQDIEQDQQQQIPLAAQRRSATSQEKRHLSTDNSRVIINLPKPTQISHFSPAKTEKKVPKVINTYELVQHENEEQVQHQPPVSSSRRNSNNKIEGILSQGRAESFENPLLSFNQKNSLSQENQMYGVVETDKKPSSSDINTLRKSVTNSGGRNSQNGRISLQTETKDQSNHSSANKKDQFNNDTVPLNTHDEEYNRITQTNTPVNSTDSQNSSYLNDQTNETSQIVNSEVYLKQDDFNTEIPVTTTKSEQHSESEQETTDKHGYSTDISNSQTKLTTITFDEKHSQHMLVSSSSNHDIKSSYPEDVISYVNEITQSNGKSMDSEIKPRIERVSAGRKNQSNVDNTTEMELDYLRRKLESVKSNRSELEMVREELIKRLKQMHSRMTIRRKEARDIWKKKYFNEKKKTPFIEDKVQSVLNEIDNIQKKITHNYESDIKAAVQNGHIQDSEKLNVKLTSFKLQQDVDGLKRQLEQAKLRLTTDIKLRNQAEVEVKTLRFELNETKSNLNDIKNQYTHEIAQ